MYTNISLAHYQLPLFGLGTNTSATDIGQDQRSIFLRPTAAVGAVTELPPIEVVQTKPKTTAPMSFEQWLDTVMIYRNAALRNDAATAEAESPAETGDAAEAAPETGDSPEPEASSSATEPAEASEAEDESAPDQPAAQPTDAATQTGSDNGGLLGRLLG